MKISREKFAPIYITIESMKELIAIYTALLVGISEKPTSFSSDEMEIVTNLLKTISAKKSAPATDS